VAILLLIRIGNYAYELQNIKVEFRLYSMSFARMSFWIATGSNIPHRTDWSIYFVFRLILLRFSIHSFINIEYDYSMILKIFNERFNILFLVFQQYD